MAVNTLVALPAVEAVDRAKARAALTGLVFGCLSLLPDIAAVILSGSATLLADVLKSGTETLALLLTWLVLLHVVRQKERAQPVDVVRLEGYVSLALATALLVSFAIVAVTALRRLAAPVLIERVELGLLVNLAAAAINARLWWQNTQLARAGQSAAVESQRRLFMTKLATNVAVLATLSGSVIFRDQPWAPYLDPVTSLLVSVLIALAAAKILTEYRWWNPAPSTAAPRSL